MHRANGLRVRDEEREPRRRHAQGRDGQGNRSIPDRRKCEEHRSERQRPRLGVHGQSHGEPGPQRVAGQNQRQGCNPKRQREDVVEVRGSDRNVGPDRHEARSCHEELAVRVAALDAWAQRLEVMCDVTYEEHDHRPESHAEDLGGDQTVALGQGARHPRGAERHRSNLQYRVFGVDVQSGMPPVIEV